MKLRTRKKYWHRYWFNLRFRGHDFHSFNMDVIRHLKKIELKKNLLYEPVFWSFDDLGI